MQKHERHKKLLIIAVTLALFSVSYYYYVHKQKEVSQKQEQTSHVKQEKIISEKLEDNKKSSPRTEENKNTEDKQQKEMQRPAPPVMKDKKEEKNTIKPTSRDDLIQMAFGSAGKNDPFSYTESNFGCVKRSDSGTSDSSGLPNPPGRNEKPSSYLEVKGFFGDKVIAEVNGLTDSLATGETLRGVKVLSIDRKNFTCQFLVNGEIVTKKMKPLTKKPHKDVDIKFVQ